VCRFVLRSVTGFGRGGGQILGFSIDLLRRPYNTLALPCECVIYKVACRKIDVPIMGILDSTCKGLMCGLIFVCNKLTARNARKTTYHRKAITFTLNTTVDVFGDRLFRRRLHTVQWTALGFRLTNSAVI